MGTSSRKSENPGYTVVSWNCGFPWGIGVYLQVLDRFAHMWSKEGSSFVANLILCWLMVNILLSEDTLKLASPNSEHPKVHNLHF